MPRGPLPQATRRRRNAPTFSTTALPASGRPGAPPKPPADPALGKVGAAEWRRLWATPQAAAWNAGDVSAVHRRSSLADDLALIDAGPVLNVEELLGVNKTEATALIRSTVTRLYSLAAGRLAIMKEMRDIEDRLGLTPAAFLRFRWAIATDEEEAEAARPKAGTAANVVSLAARFGPATGTG